MASLIHSHSCESVSSQLDVFTVPVTQTSLDEGSYVEYRPVSTLSDCGPVEFVIPGEGYSYIDFANTLLYARASLVDADGSDIDDAKNVAPVCNFLHSLWSQCDVSLNNKLVTQSSNTYPYRAYLETLLSFGQEAKQSQLSANLWARDTTGRFDESAADNVGFTARKTATAGSKEVDMLGRLHIDLAFQDRYLLSGVEVRIRLSRSKDAFCLQGDDTAAGVKISLKEVALYCRKVKPSNAIQLAHTKALQVDMVKYPLKRVVVKNFTVPRGNLSLSKENLFLGQLPTRVIFGCVDNDAFNGVLNKNPFHFKTNSINFVALYRDGVQIPSKPLQPDFENDRYVRSYLNLFTNTGQYFTDTGNNISRADFKGGNTLFAFDLTPQLGCSGFELIKNGNLRLEVHFATALPQTTTVIVYAEFDNLLQIDRTRSVLFDYNA